MPYRELAINNKGTVIIECDECKKQTFMKRKNMHDEMWQNLTNNHGILCQNCEHNKQSKELRITYSFGELYTVYPDVISVEHLRGVKRAKEILSVAKRNMAKDSIQENDQLD